MREKRGKERDKKRERERREKEKEKERKDTVPEITKVHLLHC